LLSLNPLRFGGLRTRSLLLNPYPFLLYSALLRFGGTSLLLLGRLLAGAARLLGFGSLLELELLFLLLAGKGALLLLLNFQLLLRLEVLLSLGVRLRALSG
jgi:hypothetical protein